MLLFGVLSTVLKVVVTVYFWKMLEVPVFVTDESLSTFNQPGLHVAIAHGTEESMSGHRSIHLTITPKIMFCLHMICKSNWSENYYMVALISLTNRINQFWNQKTFW